MRKKTHEKGIYRIQIQREVNSMKNCDMVSFRSLSVFANKKNVERYQPTRVEDTSPLRLSKN